MALDRSEQEVMDSKGIERNDPEAGSFVINMYQRRNAWEVRPGFGQLAQFDSTLGAGPANHGYASLLGSTTIRTTFGSIQILTVLRTEAYTGSLSSGAEVGSVYSLSIYDVTTNQRWEEVLHRHTAENSQSTLGMPGWHACYQTSSQQNFAGFPAASDTMVCFVEYQDSVLFGNADMGAWVYVPCSSGGARTQQLDNLSPASYGSPYGESSRVARISPVANPLFKSQSAYLDTASFPSPAVIALLSGRVAYASGRSVFFSDTGAPASVMGLNFITLASEQDISAMAEVNGVLWIWTRTETYIYQPNQGTLISSGRLTRLSATVGCLNPRAVTRIEGDVVWASSSGIYGSSGLQIERISDNIKPLFDEGLTAPLGSYLQSNGFTTATGDKPVLVYGWDTSDAITLAYEPFQKILLVTVPGQRFALMWQKTNWTIWSLESVCVDSPTAVGVTANINNFQLLPVDNRLFLVGGVETYTPPSNTIDNTSSGSYYILENGRGGALDRSIDPLEDNRTIAGSYVSTSVGNGLFLIDRPTALDPGYTLPQGTVMSQGGLLYPIKITPRVNATSPDKLKLAFMFDNLNWQPMCRAGTATIDAVIPTERLPSRKGWGIDAPVTGLAEVQVYNSISGLPDANGDEIHMYWDGATGQALLPWSYAPVMNLNALNQNPLIMLPFSPKTSNDTMGLGVVVTLATEGHLGVTVPTGHAYFNHASVARHNYDLSQAVDYVYRTVNIKGDSSSQLRTRGMYLRVLSHGQGLAEVASSWLYGLLNVNIGSDFKEWVSQIVDYQGNIQENTKLPLRARVKDNSGNLVNRIFDTSLTWGDTSDASKGNFLVDEEEVDTIAISDSVKGETISFTVYGHLRDRAARIIFDSMRAVIDSAGSPRRRGR
jgi:hypothetical protein